VAKAPTDSRSHQEGAIGILMNDFQLGGCERVAIRLANAWADMGIRVVLYVADNNGSLRTEVSTGVDVRCADPPIPASPLQSLRLGWWAGRRMRAEGRVCISLCSMARWVSSAGSRRTVSAGAFMFMSRILPAEHDAAMQNAAFTACFTLSFPGHAQVPDRSRDRFRTELLHRLVR